MNIKNSPEQMKLHVEAWKKSGLSMNGYTKRNNLSYYTFLYWLEKFGERKIKKRKVANGFSSVTVVPDALLKSTENIQFHVPDKGYFVFPESVSASQIKLILQSLC